MTIKRTTLRAGIAATAIGICLAAGLAGCSAGGSTLTEPCAVIEDASPSGHNFDAGNSLQERLPAFLLDNKCQQVAFVPLTYASQSSACSQPTVDISGQDVVGDVDQAALEASRRQLALQHAESLLSCARREQHAQAGGGGSDVFGALALAVTKRPPGTGTYHVLVVSDLIQHTGSADLYHKDLTTPTSRTKLITQLIYKGLIPDMTGMALEVTNRGADLVDGGNTGDLKSADFNSFWSQLFASKAAGAPQVSYD